MGQSDGGDDDRRGVEMDTSDTRSAADSELAEACDAGLLRVYGGAPDANVRERLDRELGLIARHGWARGFLSVAAAASVVRSMGVLVGPAPAGSGGSLALYVLGAGSVDPLEHSLVFERACRSSDAVLEYWMDVPSRRLDAVAAELGALPLSQSACRLEVDGATIDIRGLAVLDRQEVVLSTTCARGDSVAGG